MATVTADFTSKHKINPAPESARARVSARPSWEAFRPASPAGTAVVFDPHAAGRRAVEKHADALRRLSD